MDNLMDLFFSLVSLSRLRKCIDTCQMVLKAFK